MRGFYLFSNSCCDFKHFAAGTERTTGPRSILWVCKTPTGAPHNIQRERQGVRQKEGYEGYRSVIISHLYHQLIRWQIIPRDYNEHNPKACVRGVFFSPAGDDVMTDGARAGEQMERWKAAKWDASAALMRCVGSSSFAQTSDKTLRQKAISTSSLPACRATQQFGVAHVKDG